MNKILQYKKAMTRLDDLIDDLTRLIDEPNRLFYSKLLNKLGDLHIALGSNSKEALNEVKKAMPLLNDLKEMLEWEINRLSTIEEN